MSRGKPGRSGRRQWRRRPGRTTCASSDRYAQRRAVRSARLPPECGCLAILKSTSSRREPALCVSRGTTSVLRSGGYAVPRLSCTRAAPGELNSRAALPGQAWRRAQVPQAALKYRGSFLNAIVCMCARRWCHRTCDTCARTRTGVRAGSRGPVSNAVPDPIAEQTTACASRGTDCAGPSC
jgi:hypothetical protein